jgi:hypothetical protein
MYISKTTKIILIESKLKIANLLLANGNAFANSKFRQQTRRLDLIKDETKSSLNLQVVPNIK